MANGRKRTKGTASRPRAKRPETPAPEGESPEVEAEAEAEVSPEAMEPAPEELAEAEAEVADVVSPVTTQALVLMGESGITRKDPLQAYMAEVTRHPLLTREEEYALAKEYQQTQDVKAA
ncbi:MAG TPA: sigma-70 factor domain-containing protein, partial [Myxococcaceae bacterium]